MACYKNAQPSRCQETFTGLPEALRGKRGFGSPMKRQENVHENLFTWNCRKPSRMRIRVQLPSVWRTDVHLADNYNPLKANKCGGVLFQHELSRCRGWRRLFPSDWSPADERQTSASDSTTASGLAGQRSGPGSHQSCIRCELYMG